MTEETGIIFKYFDIHQMYDNMEQSVLNELKI
jgi:hypothetical protein